MKEYLNATLCINSDDASIISLANSLTENLSTDTDKAIAIYYKVRDDWRYNPYQIHFDENKLKASYRLAQEEGHCIDKAVIMIALARAADIPARLCLAKVKNHIATERLEEEFGTNVLVPHGYVELWLTGQWVKATPAFNQQLCEHLGVAPLEFDGKTDSIFQEYDRSGADFMEYLEDYGHFADVPINLMFMLMKQYYPRIFEEGATGSGFQIDSL